MDIKKFNLFCQEMNMLDIFLDNSLYINESNNKRGFNIISDDVKRVCNNIKRDIGLDIGFILTFSAGITALAPIVATLSMNGGLDFGVANKETFIFLTIAALTIVYKDTVKDEEIQNELRVIIKSLLEELRMKGVGDGIVKKVLNLFRNLVTLFNVIYKPIGKSILSIIGMFGFTALMIPFINGVSAVIHNYSLNLQSIIQNLSSLGLGIATLITKYGIDAIISRLNGKVDISKSDVLKDIEVDSTQDISIMTPTDNLNNLDEING